VRGEAPVPCPPADGVRLAALMSAVYQSAREARPVTVPAG